MGNGVEIQGKEEVRVTIGNVKEHIMYEAWQVSGWKHRMREFQEIKMNV